MVHTYKISVTTKYAPKAESSDVNMTSLERNGSVVSDVFGKIAVGTPA